jgi:PAS domain S-box-containing protein
MAVTAHPASQALADLALALDRSCSRIDSVCRTGARAAAEIVGDGAGILLLGDDGRFGPIAVSHPDEAVAAALTTALDRAGTEPDGGYPARLRATRRPIAVSPMTPDALAGLVTAENDATATIRAALLCPLVVDDAYAGHLLLVRTGPGGTYDADDTELARELAGELALALSSARSREALRASEERYRRVLETMPEGVLQLDEDGVTTYANEPMGVLLGVPHGQVTGLSLQGFLDARGRDDLARRTAECRAGRATTGGSRLVRADGSTRTVRMSMTPMPTDAGHPGGILCMVTDTTDHIDARGLKRQLDHLRRLDGLGQLIGGISHEFSNLLTMVAGSADMILAGAGPDSAERRLAADIVQAAESGRRLVHQLLAFGRPDGGRPETIPAGDLLADVQPLFQRILGEHIGLDIALEPGTRPIRAERGPLEQALVNLAANARDAMLHGGVLRVAAGNAQAGGPADGAYVHLSLTDTGGGMTDEVRGHAFEAFFSTKAGAAGLGLATAASIVRDLGGQIDLESAPKMGTTVHLYLPAAEPAPAPAARPAAPGAVGRILVVEDQPDVAHLVERFVERAGYTVTVTGDAADAVARVAAGQPVDLLVTDVVMPGMTGPELAAALREHHPDLPVVFMSGYTAAALGPQVRLDGNSMLVEKPFHRSTLLGAIRALGGDAGPPPA